MASEIEGIQKQLEISIKRLNALRTSYAIQSDANLKFTLEMQIANLEGEISQLKQRIQTAYGLDVFSGSSQLENKIRQLNIGSNLGEIYLVNCNRERSRSFFWNAFDTNQNHHHNFQFYFVVACPTQQPNSFSERMIYEIIIEELDEEFKAIQYISQPNSRRVKIEDLPLGRNLKNCQKEFKKYFSRRFKLAEAETSFEAYLKTGLPRLEYEFVATVFDLNASKWNPELMDQYLNWIISTFKNPKAEMPKFVFFFAIFLKNAHLESLSNREKSILEDISRIIAPNKERCTLLNRLLPVPLNLLEDWIREVGEQNQSKIDDLIRSIVNTLPEDKKRRFLDKKELDMTDIERFQELVYRIANS